MVCFISAVENESVSASLKRGHQRSLEFFFSVCVSGEESANITEASGAISSEDGNGRIYFFFMSRWAIKLVWE